MFKVIGVTGGVGSGKSRVLDYLLERHGAHVIKTDDVAKRLMKAGTACFDEIVSRLGTEIVGADGEFDRKVLADRIFNNDDERGIVDSIVHPAVKRDICESIACLRQSCTDDCLVVVESALLIEENYDLICDELWFVFVEKSMRIERLAASRGYSLAKTMSIMNSQLSDEEMRAACQVVIDNSGDFELTTQKIDVEYDRIMGK